MNQHEHSQQGPYKALEYLHGQAYPMAEYKRSVLNRMGSFMANSDRTDHVLTYVYGRPREFSKPVFET